MSGISTHILDTTAGRPAAGVGVALLRLDDGGAWQTLATKETDSDGRCRQMLPDGVALLAGEYRVRFETAAYYEAHALTGLYPFVEITFTVREGEEHLHIPLLLTANGYTTYRGS
ncbi:MAG: hydroxyisourate hydrolase [Edaphobacter sp.]|uniref:hydroxyisourate hydrolase n=1 Tax=Edaphobacter sp. TaxID=1934404 RepID=UPI002398B7AD|nr:hydroxyisourate hydrolase [Edaphobacter sp.]MDE1177953.1 hydroxyisourate hydrolase [Edaphobacter sp.]